MKTTDHDRSLIPEAREGLYAIAITLHPDIAVDLHTGTVSALLRNGESKAFRALTVRQCEALYWSERLCCAKAVLKNMRVTAPELLDIVRPLLDEGIVLAGQAQAGHDCSAPGRAQTLSILWREAVEAHSSRSLVVHDGNPLSYSEADSIVLAAASRLLSEGVSKGDRVVVYSPVHPEAALIFWAATLIGAVFVPLDFTLPLKALEPLIETVGPSIVFSSQEGYGTISGLTKAPCVAFDSTVAEASSLKKNTFSSWLDEDQVVMTYLPGICADDPAAVLFTSGSTGTPKGVVLSHGALYRSARLMARSYGWRPDDVLMNLGELHTMSGLRNACVATLHAGASFVLTDAARRSNALAVSEDASRYGVTVLCTVPALLRQFIRISGRVGKYLSALRLVLSTGSPLSQKLAEEFKDAFGQQVYNYYGLTETSGLCLGVLPGFTGKPYGTIGVPLDCIARLAGTSGETLGTGGVGELKIYSSNLMSGYYRDDERTKSILRDGWLSTGDIAFRRADGAVVIVGRMDETFKDDRGEFISPSEVESALERHRSVKEAAVCGFDAIEGGCRLAAFVVPSTQADRDKLTEELRTHITELLGPQKAPRLFFVVEDLPRGTNGKVLRKKLKEMLKR